MSRHKRYGYGYQRHEADFGHAKCDRLFLDFKGTGRTERGELFVDGVLRPGDVIVLLDARDLGAKATEAIEEMGLTIEVMPIAGKPRRVGAPLRFDPDPEQDAKLRTLWLNPGYTLRYILTRAHEIMEAPVSRNQLTRRYGNRHKR